MALLVSNRGEERLSWTLPCFRNHNRVHFADSQLRSIQQSNFNCQDALVLLRGGEFMDLVCLLVHHKTFEKKGSFS